MPGIDGAQFDGFRDLAGRVCRAGLVPVSVDEGKQAGVVDYAAAQRTPRDAVPLVGGMDRVVLEVDVPQIREDTFRVSEGFLADRQHVAHVERDADVRAVQFFAEPAHVVGRGVRMVLHRDSHPVFLGQGQRLAQDIPAPGEMGVPPARQRPAVAAEHTAHDHAQRRGTEASGRGDQAPQHSAFDLSAVRNNEQPAFLGAGTGPLQRGRGQSGQAVVGWKLHAGQSVFDGHVHELKGVISRVERVRANSY